MVQPLLHMVELNDLPTNRGVEWLNGISYAIPTGLHSLIWIHTTVYVTGIKLNSSAVKRVSYQHFMQNRAKQNVVTSQILKMLDVTTQSCPIRWLSSDMGEKKSVLHQLKNFTFDTQIFFFLISGVGILTFLSQYFELKSRHLTRKISKLIIPKFYYKSHKFYYAISNCLHFNYKILF